MRLTLFAGDIAEAPAEAVCTSSNPRLSLMMGTGGAVRDRGGWDVYWEAQRIVEEFHRRTGHRELPAGSAWVTTAGTLPYKGVIHCIASDATHHVSSADIIRICARNAMQRAAERGFVSLAMPVFATGHAGFRFDRALEAMREGLAESGVTTVDVVIVVAGEERAAEARALLGEELA